MAAVPQDAQAWTQASVVQVRVVKSVLNRDTPATCSMHIQSAISQAVEHLPGLRKMQMVSHAYHDALFMAQVAPTGVSTWEACKARTCARVECVAD